MSAFTPVKVFEKPPTDFKNAVHAAGCFIRLNEKLLVMQRSSFKHQAGRWEIPGGKFEEGESGVECVKREIFEETGIVLQKTAGIGSLFVRSPEIDWTFHLFVSEFNKEPSVQISKEHNNYKWLAMDDVQKLELIEGEQTVLDYYLKAML